MGNWIDNVLLKTARINMAHSDSGRRCFLVFGEGDGPRHSIPITFRQALDFLAAELPEDQLVFMVEDDEIVPLPKDHHGLLTEWDGRPRSIPQIWADRHSAKAALIQKLRDQIARLEKT